MAKRLKESSHNRHKNNANTTQRLQTDVTYKALNRERARARKRKMAVVKGDNHTVPEYNCGTQKRIQRKVHQHAKVTKSGTDAGKYWARRARYLHDMQLKRNTANEVSNMVLRSSTSRLNVILAIGRVTRTIDRAIIHMKCKHKRLRQTVNDIVTHISINKAPSEEDLNLMFDTRYHTTSSEAFFWE